MARGHRLEKQSRTPDQLQGGQGRCPSCRLPERGNPTSHFSRTPAASRAGNSLHGLLSAWDLRADGDRGLSPMPSAATSGGNCPNVTRDRCDRLGPTGKGTPCFHVRESRTRCLCTDGPVGYRRTKRGLSGATGWHPSVNSPLSPVLCWGSGQSQRNKCGS